MNHHNKFLLSDKSIWKALKRSLKQFWILTTQILNLTVRVKTFLMSMISVLPYRRPSVGQNHNILFTLLYMGEPAYHK